MLSAVFCSRHRRRKIMVMIERQEPPQELLALARLQSGVVSREQALGLGMGRHGIQRLLAAETWVAMHRSVYLIPAMPEPAWQSWAWAGVLIGGSGARLGGLAAGYLHGLVDEPPELIHVWVDPRRRVRAHGRWLFRREVGYRSERSFGSPPRLGVEETVIDLCHGGGPERVPHWVAKSVQIRKTTVPRLRTTLEGRERVRHRRLLEAILADVAEGAETPLEIDYLNKVERAHGLPIGHRQRRLKGSKYITDVWYWEFSQLVELDGRLGHVGIGAFRDMWRDNEHLMEGQATLRYGWYDMAGRPCAIAGQVAIVLARAGWTGTLKRCPNCPSEH